MAVSQTLAQAIAAACGAGLTSAVAVAGGDINAALRVELDDGRVLFAKHRADPPAGFFAAEAAGLSWLAEAGALPTPAVATVADGFLALEWVDSAPRADDFDARLGEGLARMHDAGAPAFGTTADGGPTFLGPLALPNEPAAGWAAFYAQRRLLPLLRMAVDGGALPDGVAQHVQRVAERMPELAGPVEPPARLHGDLWSGNVMAGADGVPLLVDPAAHGGRREVDLAMLDLFGSPGPAFRDAYAAVHPLADGHEQRVALWQLVPLLVHAILFGGAYGAAVGRAAARYA